MTAELRYASGTRAGTIRAVVIHLFGQAPRSLVIAASCVTSARRHRTFFLGCRSARPTESVWSLFPRRTTYAYQLDAFAASVLRGDPVKTTPNDAIENMGVIDAIYRAAGLPVREPT